MTMPAAPAPQDGAEALLVAGELYETAKAIDRALAVQLAYVGEFAEPVETAVETRFKIAGHQKARADDAAGSRPPIDYDASVSERTDSRRHRFRSSIASKCASTAASGTWCSTHCAAIQRSFSGIGLPFCRRSRRSSA